MLFNSLQFLIFFLIVTPIYFALPLRGRIVWLLVASCYFYAAFIPEFLLILGAIIVIDYFAGIGIEKAVGLRRKTLLAVSLIANFGILFVFKYYNFFGANLNRAFSIAGFTPPIPILNLILPLGLSFHTFQAVSYTIEVYRGHQRAERNFFIYALYVMFYPQLVAGPIERPQNLLHQFMTRQKFSWQNLLFGLQLIIWGLFKKVVIADRLTVLVDTVFGQPQNFSGGAIAIAVYFFTIQIYCDFSGYSDIARGTAQVMGYDLMVNFNKPYSASSIQDFWRRWHISLSTWFRDYVYKPLGGRGHAFARNTLLVFLLSGMWHGANWTFVIWGLYHGLCVLTYGFIKPRLKDRRIAYLSDLLARYPSIPRWCGVIFTFHIVAFGWIFFRANGIKNCFTIVSSLMTKNWQFFETIDLVKNGRLGLNSSEFILSLILIVFLFCVEKLQTRIPIRATLFKFPAYVQSTCIYAAIFLIYVLGKFTSHQFIYFQF